MIHISNLYLTGEYYVGRKAYLFALEVLLRWQAGDLVLDRDTAMILEGFKCAHENIEREGVKICDASAKPKAPSTSRG